jgi:hypothetical protein
VNLSPESWSLLTQICAGGLAFIVVILIITNTIAFFISFFRELISDEDEKSSQEFDLDGFTKQAKKRSKTSKKNNHKNNTAVVESPPEPETKAIEIKYSFEEQLEILEGLGYKLNPDININKFKRQIKDMRFGDGEFEQVINDPPFQSIYQALGFAAGYENYVRIDFGNKPIYYDYEIMASEISYKLFFEEFIKLTDGELEVENVSVDIINEKRHLKFEINDKNYDWELGEVKYISADFVDRLPELTDEYETEGRFYYNDMGQAMALDYMTPDEKVKFEEITEIPLKEL